jgi:hypothetical protein
MHECSGTPHPRMLAPRQAREPPSNQRPEQPALSRTEESGGLWPLGSPSGRGGPLCSAFFFFFPVAFLRYTQVSTSSKAGPATKQSRCSWGGGEGKKWRSESWPGSLTSGRSFNLSHRKCIANPYSSTIGQRTRFIPGQDFNRHFFKENTEPGSKHHW